MSPTAEMKAVASWRASTGRKGQPLEPRVGRFTRRNSPLADLDGSGQTSAASTTGEFFLYYLFFDFSKIYTTKNIL